MMLRPTAKASEATAVDPRLNPEADPFKAQLKYSKKGAKYDVELKVDDFKSVKVQVSMDGKTKVNDNLKEYTIERVKSLLKTEDNFTKEEVNYLLASMYDRVRIINKEAIVLSSKILQDIIEFSNYLNLSEGGETSASPTSNEGI